MYCKKCGTPMMTVYSQRDGWVKTCIKCGQKENAAEKPEIGEESAKQAFRGQSFFVVQDFENAEAGFHQAFERGGRQPEYLWAVLLAKYGIKYCETENGQEQYIVNFWKAELPRELMMETEAYQELAAAAADRGSEELQYYQQEAEEIDRGLAEIHRLAAEGVEYDIFLSYKDTAADGRRTPESKLCEDLYHELRDAGRKVFYSRRTLAGKMVTDFEGHIYTALRTSKLMLLATSREDYVRSPWVESEWKRYLKWNKGQENRLMTCRIGDMSAGGFPRDLSRIQHELHVKEERIEQGDQATTKWISGDVKQRHKALLEREKTEKARQNEEKKDADVQNQQRHPQATSQDKVGATLVVDSYELESAKQAIRYTKRQWRKSMSLRYS